MTDYYVATNGNDSNPGTSALPFASVVKGCAVAIGGDRVIVRPGVYAQIVPAQLKGAVHLLGQEGAIIDGGNTNTRLLDIVGPDALVQRIVFRNITAPGTDNELAPPAIRMDDIQNSAAMPARIQLCTFQNTGIGVLLDNGCTSVYVTRNTFLNTDYTAVMMRDGTNACTISHNVIQQTGFRYGEGGAIGLHGAHSIKVVWNLIEDSAYHGVNEQNHGAPVAGNNFYERNLIRRACVMSDDGGGLYAFKRGTMRSYWRDNYIEDVGHPSESSRIAWGIYLDDLVADVDVVRNHVVNCRSGIMVHGGENNRVINNIVNMTLGSTGWPGAFGIQVQECDAADGEDGYSANLTITGNAVLSSQEGAVGATEPVVPSWWKNNHYVLTNGTWGFDFEPYAVWTAQGGDVGTALYNTLADAIAGSGIIVRPMSFYGPQ